MVCVTAGERRSGVDEADAHGTTVLMANPDWVGWYYEGMGGDAAGEVMEKILKPKGFQITDLSDTEPAAGILKDIGPDRGEITLVEMRRTGAADGAEKSITTSAFAKAFSGSSVTTKSLIGTSTWSLSTL